MKDNQDSLVTGFNDYLNEYFSTFLEKLDEGFKSRTDEVVEDFAQNVTKVENKIEQQSEKKQKNKTILENTKFIFANVIFVLVAIVLTRALFYGLWEGFNVKGLYEWGIQWNWLKYTMWALFVGIIGALMWSLIQFVKVNFKRFF